MAGVDVGAYMGPTRGYGAGERAVSASDDEVQVGRWQEHPLPAGPRSISIVGSGANAFVNRKPFTLGLKFGTARLAAITFPHPGCHRSTVTREDVSAPYLIHVSAQTGPPGIPWSLRDPCRVGRELCGILRRRGRSQAVRAKSPPDDECCYRD